MSDGQAKITITGDASQAVAAANKLGASLKGAAEHASGIEKAVERSNHHLVAAVGKAASLLAIFEAAGNAVAAMNERAKKTAEGNREAGAGALNRSRALTRLGITDISGTMDAIKTTSGGATIAEQDSALEAFSSASAESRFIKLPNGQKVNENAGGYGKKELLQYMRLVSSGVYTQDELLKRVKRGMALPTDEEAQRDFNAMPAQAKQELYMRDQERMNKNRELDALSGPGAANRLAESDLAARKAERPGSFGMQDVVKETLGGLPGVGKGITGGIDASQRETMIVQRQQQLLLSDIANSNRNMARGAVNLSGQSEGAQ